MERVAAGAHLPTHWFFESAKRLDDRADYCLGCSPLPQCKHQVLVFTLEWNGARPESRRRHEIRGSVECVWCGMEYALMWVASECGMYSGRLLGTPR